MAERKIEFSKIAWEDSAPGICSKSYVRNGVKLRLLKLERGLSHPEWCETGHIGYVVEGEIEIDFNGDPVRYGKGDSLLISSGPDEKHIPKPLSETVALFLVEDE